MKQHYFTRYSQIEKEFVYVAEKRPSIAIKLRISLDLFTFQFLKVYLFFNHLNLLLDLTLNY